MPDTDIERLAGDGLEPTPAFVASLREQMRGEWHADGVAVTPPRQRPWRVAAGFVAAVAAFVGVGLLTTRGDDTDSIVVVDSTASTASTTSPPSTTPTEGLPDSAMEQLWVIMSVDGIALPGPDMPTFTPHADGTVTGWDGCNQYELTSEGGEGTTAGCPEGVTPVQARGPFVVDSLDAVHTDAFTASTFGREPAAVSAPLPLEGTYSFGDVGRLRLTPEGFVSIESHGCEIAVQIRWFVANGNFLTFGFRGIPDCYGLDAAFVAWLTQMRDLGRPYVIDGDPPSAMWTRIGDRVTRLGYEPG